VEVFMRPPVARPGFLKPCFVVMFAALGLVPATSRAAEPPVELGEVSASTPAGEFTEPLRSALTAGIAGAVSVRPRERFILSATLVRLDAERVGKGARATAAVSLVLRRAREHSLHAILKGQATAEETHGSMSETREDALRAAVSSALRRLPEALR
jgi:hypothetical protein